MDRKPHNGTSGRQKSSFWTENGPYRFAPKGGGDSWEACLKKVDQYNDETCKVWKEDIDTHMVFAGLFSAAVTAFTVESFKWLQPDHEETTVLLLLQISEQLGNVSMTARTPFVPDLQKRPSNSGAVRINIFWFLSLTISLSSVLLGILSKQWLQQHRRVTYTRSQKEALALSQLRDESIRYWGLPGILTSLPIMLQAALLLFFAGLLDLLWSLDTVVAAIVSLVIGITILFLLFTTIAPVLTMQTAGSSYPCAYKSPQAWVVYKFWHAIIRKVFRNRDQVYNDWSRSDLYLLNNRSGVSRRSIVAVLRWVVRAFADNIETAIHIFNCLQDLPADEAAHVLGWSWIPDRDRINYDFFCQLRCGWNEAVYKFIGELRLRRAIARDRDPRDVERANFMETKLSKDDEEKVCHQIIHCIRRYLEDVNIHGCELVSLLSTSRLLWCHPNPLIRDQSRALLDDFSERLADDGAFETSEMVRECAWMIMDIIEDSHCQNPHSWMEFARFVRTVDRALSSKDIRIDSHLTDRGVKLTWKEGMIKLSDIVGLDANYFVNC